MRGIKLNTLYWLLFGLVVIAAGLLVGWIFLSYRTSTSTAPTLTLVDTPDRFCPKEIGLASVSPGEPLIALPIQNCRTAALSTIYHSSFTRQKQTLTVYIPGALASTITLDQKELHPTWYPRLGDTNGDNQINNLDRQNIIESLNRSALEVPKDKLVDFDNDGQVTAFDLALVQVNQGVGVARPDGKSWSER